MGKEMSSLLIVSFLRDALSIIQLRIEDNHILGVVGVLFETLKNISSYVKAIVVPKFTLKVNLVFRTFINPK